jgi:cell division transport system ATP-binding protein
VIELHHVHMTYANEFKALRDINLRIERGEFVMVTGPSGAGKSTLIRLLCREFLPTQGQVIVDEQNIAKLKPRQVPRFRRRLGVVFQDFNLLYDRTVFENVALALHVLRYPGRRIQLEVLRALDRVGLAGKRHQMPWHLSGGERQRVVLARAIVHDPPLLLADEPTGNLDFATGWGIMQLFKQMAETGTTVICTTHNLNFIQKLRRRTLFLDQGLLRADESGHGAHVH